MGYESLEITATALHFERERLPMLLETARNEGYDTDAAPDDDDPEVDPEVAALEEVLRQLFPCNWDLSEDLEASDLAFDYCFGDMSPVEDAAAIFAQAAVSGSTMTILDFAEGSRDIYDIVFDGEGSFSRRYYVRDGVPVRQ